jgi:hypothetical protein
MFLVLVYREFKVRLLVLEPFDRFFELRSFTSYTKTSGAYEGTVGLWPV